MQPIVLLEHRVFFTIPRRINVGLVMQPPELWCSQLVLLQRAFRRITLWYGNTLPCLSLIFMYFFPRRRAQL